MSYLIVMTYHIAGREADKESECVMWAGACEQVYVTRRTNDYKNESAQTNLESVVV